MKAPFPEYHPWVILGIDEAGRGPVMGPLVVAAVLLHPRRAGALTRLGVRDSKFFGTGGPAAGRRGQLFGHVKRLADWVGVRVFPAQEVDRRTLVGELNELEREAARSLLAEIPAGLKPQRILADGEKVFASLASDFPDIEALDHAESRHVAVAAASVVAKVRRDRLFTELLDRIRHEYREQKGEDFGPIQGSGYANEATEAFLRAYHRRTGALPPGVRHAWNWPVIRELSPRRSLFQV